MQRELHAPIDLVFITLNLSAAEVIEWIQASVGKLNYIAGAAGQHHFVIPTDVGLEAEIGRVAHFLQEAAPELRGPAPAGLLSARRLFDSVAMSKLMDRRQAVPPAPARPPMIVFGNQPEPPLRHQVSEHFPNDLTASGAARAFDGLMADPSTLARAVRDLPDNARKA